MCGHTTDQTQRDMVWSQTSVAALPTLTKVSVRPQIESSDIACRLGRGRVLPQNRHCLTFCHLVSVPTGWPKLAQHTLWATPDSGVAVGILAPASASTPAGSVAVTTDYPFGDYVRIEASALLSPFPVYVRVPGWAGGDGEGGGTAELLVESSAGSKPLSLAGKNGTFILVGHAPVGKSAPLRATLRLKPTMRIEEWSSGGFSVHRGPLMFALPVAPAFTTVAHHFGTPSQSNDYDTTNASQWQYALVANRTDPSADLTFERVGGSAPAPFNHTGWPVVVRARVRPLPGWTTSLNSAAEPPVSPACAAAGSCGAEEDVLLVPFGASDLRIGMFPLA